jgi:hypothetical protein
MLPVNIEGDGKSEVDQASHVSSGTCHHRGAEIVECVSGRANGERIQERAGRLSATAHLFPRLVNAAVSTEQVQNFMQRTIVVEIGVEQLE